MRGERLRQAKKRARRVLRVWRACALPFDVEHLVDDGPLEQAMRYTRVLCSGPCCGNPRRHFGERTVQERKFDEQANEQERVVR